MFRNNGELIEPNTEVAWLLRMEQLSHDGPLGRDIGVGDHANLLPNKWLFSRVVSLIKNGPFRRIYDRMAPSCHSY